MKYKEFLLQEDDALTLRKFVFTFNRKYKTGWSTENLIKELVGKGKMHGPFEVYGK